MRYDYLVRLFGGELRRDYIERRYGKAFWVYMAPELLAMRALGATRHDADAIRLTRRGMYCWVLMMAEFFNSVNAVREQMREHIRAELDAWNEEAKVPAGGHRPHAFARGWTMTMQDTHVSLAHGNGGRYMRELIHEIFARHLGNPLLNTDADAAVLPWNAADGELAFTTDSFTVQPLEFPGGNIGSLAVHGTTNDLAVSGATPEVPEPGRAARGRSRVRRARASRRRHRSCRGEIGVVVAAGDTKVVRRGEGGGIYLNTSGIGVRNPRLRLGIARDPCR